MIKYRFWKIWWRKAECGVCWALVKLPKQHALWHYKRGEFREWGEGTVSSFMDITICDTIDGPKVVEKTGWVSTGTGPG